LDLFLSGRKNRALQSLPVVLKKVSLHERLRLLLHQKFEPNQRPISTIEPPQNINYQHALDKPQYLSRGNDSLNEKLAPNRNKPLLKKQHGVLSLFLSLPLIKHPGKDGCIEILKGLDESFIGPYIRWLVLDIPGVDRYSFKRRLLEFVNDSPLGFLLGDELCALALDG